MKIIRESKMNFGEFEEKDLFHIEESKIYKNLGSGIKTVEFILKYNKDSILFLEAKESCPNAANRYETEEKQEKFEEYYRSITEKFITSLQIYLASLLEKYDDISEIGSELSGLTSLKNVKLKCILVIKNAEDFAWLAGPMAELNERLLPVKKIWGLEVAVLNEELAKQYRLIC